MWPIEIAEDILMSILAFVEENMKITEINENVTLRINFSSAKFLEKSWIEPMEAVGMFSSAKVLELMQYMTRIISFISNTDRITF